MPVTGFELVGLIGTIKATTDIIDNSVQALNAYNSAGNDADKLQLAFEADSAALKRFAFILANVGKVAAGVAISQDERKLHEDIITLLQSLEARLRERLTKLTSTHFEEEGLPGKAAWALWRKRDLERLEKELQGWIRRLWVIYAAMDAEMQIRHKRNTSEGQMEDLVSLFSQYSARPVREEVLLKPFGEIRIQGEPSRRMATSAVEPGVGSLRPGIVEYMYRSYSEALDGDEITRIGSATRDLARVLHRSDPEQTRILKCYGYFHDERTRRFGLLYELPPAQTWIPDASGQARVLSLRELFNRVPHFPLNHRLRFCCDLAQAVLYVHLVGWVHKSIRPDNILVFQDQGEPALSFPRRRFPYTLASPYLAGFEYARNVQTLSDRKSDAEWHVNIYRHPKRQFLEQNTEYTMAHDIYSLGVVFLELGLWGSNGFVPFPKREGVFKGCTPEKVREELLSIATGGGKSDGVAVFMGGCFSELVSFCLNIDEKEEIPSSAFVREIWLKLDEIRSAI